MGKRIVQIGAGLAVALPLTAFAITSTGGGTFLGNVSAAGYGQDKIDMCHNGHTISVPAPAVPAHQAQGDTIGACT